MKQLHILIFTISLLFTVSVLSQQQQDTIITKEKYGLRLGIDLSQPIISFLDEDVKGFGLVGDFRFKTNYYAAVELGFQEKNSHEDFFNFTTKGSYIKVGVNYNAYENWIGMNNEIYAGIRYGMSFFSQTLNDYTINVKGTYFDPAILEPDTEFSDLNAQWIDFIFGLKVETFNNVYLGLSFSIKKMIKTVEPDNFKNLHVPGFNRVFSNDMGVGFNYTISYLIPIFKKNK